MEISVVIGVGLGWGGGVARPSSSLSDGGDMVDGVFWCLVLVLAVVSTILLGIGSEGGSVCNKCLKDEYSK